MTKSFQFTGSESEQGRKAKHSSERGLHLPLDVSGKGELFFSVSLMRNWAKIREFP